MSWATKGACRLHVKGMYSCRAPVFLGAKLASKSAPWWFDPMCAAIVILCDSIIFVLKLYLDHRPS
uniref:Uncharacterized protein n=1 Tax=Setaria viridis TaxID=4556 RepID=A0A4U6WDP7_SETVI|nr:hypothetical protein SEVIR_1G160250v2 [Setaria viridis]